MSRLLESLRDEHGLSLAELLVATALMGFVLAAAYAGVVVINKSNDISGAAATIGHDMSDPVEQMSKSIMQNNGMDTATYPPGWLNVQPSGNQLLVWTNPRLILTPDLNAFYATSAGELVWERWTYSSDKSSYTGHVRWVMSTHNGNVAQNVPLFRYYDATGAQITDMTKVPAYARSVLITNIVKSGSASYEDTRAILFRNRN